MRARPHACVQLGYSGRPIRQILWAVIAPHCADRDFVSVNIKQALVTREYIILPQNVDLVVCKLSDDEGISWLVIRIDLEKCGRARTHTSALVARRPHRL
jgi:hypothetical protein